MGQVDQQRARQGLVGVDGRAEARCRQRASVQSGPSYLIPDPISITAAGHRRRTGLLPFVPPLRRLYFGPSTPLSYKACSLDPSSRSISTFVSLLCRSSRS